MMSKKLLVLFIIVNTLFTSSAYCIGLPRLDLVSAQRNAGILAITSGLFALFSGIHHVHGEFMPCINSSNGITFAVAPFNLDIGDTYRLATLDDIHGPYFDSNVYAFSGGDNHWLYIEHGAYLDAGTCGADCDIVLHGHKLLLRNGDSFLPQDVSLYSGSGRAGAPGSDATYLYVRRCCNEACDCANNNATAHGCQDALKQGNRLSNSQIAGIAIGSTVVFLLALPYLFGR